MNATADRNKISFGEWGSGRLIQLEKNEAACSHHCAVQVISRRGRCVPAMGRLEYAEKPKALALVKFCLIPADGSRGEMSTRGPSC